jgi:hypothetical protein
MDRKGFTLTPLKVGVFMIITDELFMCPHRWSLSSKTEVVVVIKMKITSLLIS